MRSEARVEVLNADGGEEKKGEMEGLCHTGYEGKGMCWTGQCGGGE